VILSLALLWTAGVVVMGTRWAGGWLLLRRMRRTAGAVPEACARVFEACRAELGLRRRATLAAHALVWSPLTLGLARPLILVPPAWPDVPPPVQRAGLLHELAHLARYDDWAALALELLRAVFFFHPLVHWLLARIERERELLCDETVLARGIEPRAYVRMLLDFSRQPGRLLPAALLGQPHSLGFGRRRTVKARIHHLLEENMSRWMSPLSPRRALALGTVVLALAVGLGSLRVRALAPEAEPDPPEPAQPPAAREDGGTRPAAEGGQQAEKALPTAERKEALRYGGKNFYEWRAELTTELKPEIRVEGLKALSAFGANGYEKEAAAAILEVVRGYDVALGDPDDGKVIDAAQQALAKIGPVAVQALTAEFKAGTRNSRRFALKALLRIGANDKSMVPVFLAALKDEDAYVRRSVIGDLFRSGNIPKAVDFAPALVGALKDEDPQVRSLAVEKLERIALHAKSSAKSAVPVLIELLRDQDSHIRILVAQTLRAIGPDAKAAVPALTELLKEDNLTLRMIATDALNKIGK
jgi:beta-lactamase regulating signal transducer with metallopeptidase domain